MYVILAILSNAPRYATDKELRKLMGGGPIVPRVLLVDGYNVINGDARLKEMAAAFGGTGIEKARAELQRLATVYAKSYKCLAVVVYDAEGARGPTRRYIASLFTCRILNIIARYILSNAVRWNARAIAVSVKANEGSYA